MLAEAGYYVDTNASIIQTPCAAGSWQNETNQTSCLLAEAGYSVCATASTTQTACVLGSCQPQPDSSLYLSA